MLDLSNMHHPEFYFGVSSGIPKYGCFFIIPTPSVSEPNHHQLVSLVISPASGLFNLLLLFFISEVLVTWYMIGVKKWDQKVWKKNRIYSRQIVAATCPSNIFQLCGVGLLAVRGGMVKSKVAAYLHSVALQQASGRTEGAHTLQTVLRAAESASQRWE